MSSFPNTPTGSSSSFSAAAVMNLPPHEKDRVWKRVRQFYEKHNQDGLATFDEKISIVLSSAVYVEAELFAQMCKKYDVPVTVEISEAQTAGLMPSAPSSQQQQQQQQQQQNAYPATTTAASSLSSSQLQLEQQSSSSFMNNNTNDGSAGGGSFITPSASGTFTSFSPSKAASFSHSPVKDLPQPEKTRLDKRIRLFYERHHPAGLTDPDFEANMATVFSTYKMREAQVMAKMCEKYKVPTADERREAAEAGVLPDDGGDFVGEAESTSTVLERSSEIPDYCRPHSSVRMYAFEDSLLVRKVMRLTSKLKWESRYLVLSPVALDLYGDDSVLRRSIAVADILECNITFHWQGTAIALVVRGREDCVLRSHSDAPKQHALRHVAGLLAELNPAIGMRFETSKATAKMKEVVGVGRKLQKVEVAEAEAALLTSSSGGDDHHRAKTVPPRPRAMVDPSDLKTAASFIGAKKPGAATATLVKNLSAQDKDRLKRRVRMFYVNHHPEGLSTFEENIKTVLDEYALSEDELLLMMCKKYGVDPKREHSRAIAVHVEARGPYRGGMTVAAAAAKQQEQEQEQNNNDADQQNDQQQQQQQQQEQQEQQSSSSDKKHQEIIKNNSSVPKLVTLPITPDVVLPAPTRIVDLKKVPATLSHFSFEEVQLVRRVDRLTSKLKWESRILCITNDRVLLCGTGDVAPSVRRVFPIKDIAHMHIVIHRDGIAIALCIKGTFDCVIRRTNTVLDQSNINDVAGLLAHLNRSAIVTGESSTSTAPLSEVVSVDLKLEKDATHQPKDQPPLEMYTRSWQKRAVSSPPTTKLSSSTSTSNKKNDISGSGAAPAASLSSPSLQQQSSSQTFTPAAAAVDPAETPVFQLPPREKDRVWKRVRLFYENHNRDGLPNFEQKMVTVLATAAYPEDELFEVMCEKYYVPFEIELGEAADARLLPHAEQEKRNPLPKQQQQPKQQISQAQIQAANASSKSATSNSTNQQVQQQQQQQRHQLPATAVVAENKMMTVTSSTPAAAMQQPHHQHQHQQQQQQQQQSNNNWMMTETKGVMTSSVSVQHDAPPTTTTTTTRATAARTSRLSPPRQQRGASAERETQTIHSSMTSMKYAKQHAPHSHFEKKKSGTTPTSSSSTSPPPKPRTTMVKKKSAPQQEFLTWLFGDSINNLYGQHLKKNGFDNLDILRTLNDTQIERLFTECLPHDMPMGHKFFLKNKIAGLVTIPPHQLTRFSANVAASSSSSTTTTPNRRFSSPQNNSSSSSTSARPAWHGAGIAVQKTRQQQQVELEQRKPPVPTRFVSSPISHGRHQQQNRATTPVLRRGGGGGGDGGGGGAINDTNIHHHQQPQPQPQQQYYDPTSSSGEQTTDEGDINNNDYINANQQQQQRQQQQQQQSRRPEWVGTSRRVERRDTPQQRSSEHQQQRTSSTPQKKRYYVVADDGVDKSIISPFRPSQSLTGFKPSSSSSSSTRTGRPTSPKAPHHHHHQQQVKYNSSPSPQKPRSAVTATSTARQAVDYLGQSLLVTEQPTVLAAASDSTSATTRNNNNNNNNNNNSNTGDGVMRMPMTIGNDDAAMGGLAQQIARERMLKEEEERELVAARQQLAAARQALIERTSATTATSEPSPPRSLEAQQHQYRAMMLSAAAAPTTRTTMPMMTTAPPQVVGQYRPPYHHQQLISPPRPTSAMLNLYP